MIYTNEYAEMLDKFRVKYIEAIYPIYDCPIRLVGESITRHLRGCDSVLICAATLGEEFDRLLRRLQVTDMTGAVIIDSMSGKYLERQLCELQTNCVTTRFSPGYGDFPLSINRDIVAALYATTKIGLCVTDDYILTPQKSITGVAGLNIERHGQ